MTTSGPWPNGEETLAQLAGAQRGDPAAINALLERYRAILRRIVSLRIDRKLGRRVDASDIVQDVLLEANQRLADYLNRPQLPFHLWLRQLAQDRLIEMHRRHRGAQRRSMDREQALDRSNADASFAPNIQPPDHELTPAAANIRRELEEKFLSAIEHLEEADRDIILMRHFEQLGNTEAAEVLGLSPAAAGMRHLRALRRLRSILGDQAADLLPG